MAAPGAGQPSSGVSAGDTPQTVQVKLVLLGQAAVGKSCLVLRFVRNEFQDNREPTIGAAFLTQRCTIDNKTVKYQIWDTAGQERFHSLAPMYYRNAAAAVVVYDITSKSSFDMAKVWVRELKVQANQDIVIAMVGNKTDLVAQRGESVRQVSLEEVQAYVKEASLLHFEASAKDGTGVTEIFTSIARKIPFEEILARAAARNPDVLNDTNSARDFPETCSC